ncbi:unnamed protein product [Pylaiella littoralis]
MKDHVRILVCGDERVGKSTFIGAVMARSFAREVPGMMADVQIPPEDNDDDVFCTVVDSSALPRDQRQLIEKIRSADSILVLYDVQRPDTLANLDAFWLPLIEANANHVPVVIVRNKMDTLVAEVDRLGERSVDLKRQMEPLEKRFSCFHMSIECSSVTQMGINQALCHARGAALHPRAPLYDAQEEKLKPPFDKAMRRLFRIYDADRDGLLSDDELNAFQSKSFRVFLSEEDLDSLRKILSRLAAGGGQDADEYFRWRSEGAQGAFTVEGFLRLIQLFIDKKHMKAPWQAMTSHHYDEELVLTVPKEVADPPLGKTTADQQVLAPAAQKFLLQLFQQFSEESGTPAGRVLTGEGQAEVFSVIPDPACASWDKPRSLGEDCPGHEDVDFQTTPFARLMRAPGAGRAMTAEAWMAHWQMLALHSPLLLRTHLFYVGFKGHAENMLVNKPSRSHRAIAAAAATAPARTGRGRGSSAIEVFVLGSRGCGKSRLIKALRLGDDLGALRRSSGRGRGGGGGSLATAAAAAPAATTDQEREEPEASGSSASTAAAAESKELGESREALLPGRRDAGGGGGGRAQEREQEGEEEEWEMMADPEVPETCCGFARLEEGEGAGGYVSSVGGSSSSMASSCGCASLSVTVTEVPESFSDSFVVEQAPRCDLALLVFDPSSRESLDFITPLVADIPPGVPRLVVSCASSSREADPRIVRAAEETCRELELTPVIMADAETGEGLEGGGQLRQKITAPVCKGMLPFEERQRKASRNRKIYIVVAIAVAAGLVCAGRVHSGGGGAGGGGGGGWEAGVGGALRAPVRVVKRVAAVAADYYRRWRRAAGGGGGGEVLGGYVGAVGSL